MGIIGKVGASMLNDFAKAFAHAGGSEAGKRVGKIGTEQEKKRFIHMGDFKASIEVISKDYDWNIIDRNLHNVGSYMEAIIPAIAETFVGFVTLPALAGAVTFAVIGTGASTTVYMISNVTIVAGGACKVIHNIMQVRSDFGNNKERKDGDSDFLKEFKENKSE